VASGDHEAASALARLAEAEVPGASPDDWYGLAAPSTEDPLVDLAAAPEPAEDGGEPVPPTVSVSPSRIGTYEECPVHWFVQTFGGSAPSPAMGIGTIVHAAMEHATEVDVESLWQHVEGRWDELTFESPWVADRERARTRRMIEGLSDYLRTFASAGRRLLGAETSFALVTGPARMRGSIDRIEVDPDGRVSVVDLKTGRSMPSEKTDMPEHPQLGAYQLAVEDGAVDGVPAGSEMADARLVFVQNPRGGHAYSERTQQAFDDDARAAYRQRLHTVATGMAGRTFLANVDDHCEKARTGVECRIHVVGEVTW
jgi:RecB family exonuclease